MIVLRLNELQGSALADVLEGCFEKLDRPVRRSLARVRGRPVTGVPLVMVNDIDDLAPADEWNWRQSVLRRGTCQEGAWDPLGGRCDESRRRPLVGSGEDREALGLLACAVTDMTRQMAARLNAGLGEQRFMAGDGCVLVSVPRIRSVAKRLRLMLEDVVAAVMVHETVHLDQATASCDRQRWDHEAEAQWVGFQATGSLAPVVRRAFVLMGGELPGPYRLFLDLAEAADWERGCFDPRDPRCPLLWTGTSASQASNCSARLPSVARLLGPRLPYVNDWFVPGDVPLTVRAAPAAVLDGRFDTPVSSWLRNPAGNEASTGPGRHPPPRTGCYSWIHRAWIGETGIVQRDDGHWLDEQFELILPR